MANKIFNAEEIKTQKVGVNQDDPLSYVDVEGDVFANQYQFGHEQGITWAQSLVIDFDGNIIQSCQLDGATVFSTTNRTALTDHLKAVTVRILAGDESRALDFDNSIRFLGNTPTGLAKGKMGILSLNSFGPSEEDTVAVYRTEGEFLVGIPADAVLFNKENQITGEACFTYDTSTNPRILQVGGHVRPCTGVHDAGTFNLGSLTQYWKSIYLDATEITIDNVNTKYYVSEDVNAPAHVAVGELNTSTNYKDYFSKEVIITTKELNISYTGHHELQTPDGKRFYVDEIGFVVTSGENVTEGPNVQFGYGSLADPYLYNSGLIENVGIDIPLDSYDRERYMTPKTSCGVNRLVATVTEAATATKLYGKFYYKGMFVENEYS